MKRCGLCGEVKATSEFQASSRTPDGRHTYCRPCSAAYVTATRYGLTIDERAALVRAGCFICGSHENLEIDHDHTCCSIRSCGKCIRGVLCGNHNRGIGHFYDDPEMLEAAAAYLRSGWRWQRPPETPRECPICTGPVTGSANKVYCSKPCKVQSDISRRRIRAASS